MLDRQEEVFVARIRLKDLDLCEPTFQQCFVEHTLATLRLYPHVAQQPACAVIIGNTTLKPYTFPQVVSIA